MKNVLLLLAVAFCSTVTFKPDTKTGQDAFIVTDYGCIRTGETVATDDKNFGDRIELDMAGWTVSAAGCGNMTNRSLLKFNELSLLKRVAIDA